MHPCHAWSMSGVAWCTFRHVSNSDMFVKMATTTILLLLLGCFCLTTNMHWWWCICWTTTCQINKFAPHSKQSPTEQHQRSQVTSSSVTVMDNNPTRRDRLGQTTDCSSVKKFCNNSSSAHAGMDRKTLCPPEPKIHWTTKGGIYWIMLWTNIGGSYYYYYHRRQWVACAGAEAKRKDWNCNKEPFVHHDGMLQAHESRVQSISGFLLLLVGQRPILRACALAVWRSLTMQFAK